VSSVEEIEKAFETGHSAFPVHNIADNLCGVMPRRMLHKLIEKKAFYTQHSEIIKGKCYHGDGLEFPSNDTNYIDIEAAPTDKVMTSADYKDEKFGKSMIEEEKDGGLKEKLLASEPSPDPFGSVLSPPTSPIKSSLIVDINKTNSNLTVSLLSPGVRSDVISEYNKSYIQMDKKFRLNWDAQEGLPDTPKEEILDWRVFNENMYSVEPKVDSVK